MRTALESREYLAIDECRNILDGFFGRFEWVADDTATENESAAWATKRFVCSCSEDVESKVKRIRKYFCSDEPRDVCNVSHEECAHFICDCGKLCVIQTTWVSTKSCKNNFWLCLKCNLAHFFKIDFTGFNIFHAVAHEVVELCTSGDGMTVGEVTAVVEFHGKDGVAWFEPCLVHGDVCGSS